MKLYTDKLFILFYCSFIVTASAMHGSQKNMNPRLEIIIPSLSQRSINNIPSDAAQDIDSGITIPNELSIKQAISKSQEWHLSSLETQSSCASNQAVYGNLDTAIEQSPAPHQSPITPSTKFRQSPTTASDRSETLQIYVQDAINQELSQASVVADTYLTQREQAHYARLTSSTGIILLSAAAQPMIQKMIERLHHQNYRFIESLGAVHALIAAAPTVITCALCAFGVYKIDSMLHAEERANFIVLKKELDDRFQAINNKIEIGVSNWHNAQITINEIATKIESVSTNDQRMKILLQEQILPSVKALQHDLCAWRLNREIKDIAPAIPQDSLMIEFQEDQAVHKKTMSEKFNKRITRIFGSK